MMKRALLLSVFLGCAVSLRADVADNGMETWISAASYSNGTLHVEAFVVGCGFVPTKLVNLDRSAFAWVDANDSNIGVGYSDMGCYPTGNTHLIYDWPVSLGSGTHYVSLTMFHNSDTEWSAEVTVEVP